jgi:hypothetical protein
MNSDVHNIHLVADWDVMFWCAPKSIRPIANDPEMAHRLGRDKRCVDNTMPTDRPKKVAINGSARICPETNRLARLAKKNANNPTL